MGGAGEGLLTARWAPNGSCSGAAVEGTGYVNITFDAPEMAQVSLEASRLVALNDPASCLGTIPSTSTVAVVLKYGKTSLNEDVTKSTRTIYDDITGDPSDLFTIRRNKDGSAAIHANAGKNFGKAKLLVTFVQWPGLVGEVVVEVVGHWCVNGG